MAHPITWIEFNSKNVAESREFYGSIFGWQFEDTHIDDYVAFNPGAGPGGGFSASFPAGTPQHVLFISVDDIEAKLKEITQAGGRVVLEKMDIGGGAGFCAQFADPHGNIVGLWSNK